MVHNTPIRKIINILNRYEDTGLTLINLKIEIIKKTVFIKPIINKTNEKYLSPLNPNFPAEDKKEAEFLV